MVRGLDGKSLFAEAITSAEAEQNATKLLAKALTDLPKVLTASVQGKPHYDRATSELIVDIVHEVDVKAYREFSTRLQDTLKKISVAKEAETLQLNGIQSNATKDGWLVRKGVSDLIGPKIGDYKGKVWCFWVCDTLANNHSELQWNSYILDAEISTTILLYATPYRIPRTISPKFFVRTLLFDSDESVVAEDEFPPLENKQLTWLALIGPQSGKDLIVPRTAKEAQKDFPVNAYLAPFAMTVPNDNGFGYQTKQTYQRRIKLPLDKLKLIEDVKCTVIYKPDAAATK